MNKWRFLSLLKPPDYPTKDQPIIYLNEYNGQPVFVYKVIRCQAKTKYPVLFGIWRPSTTDTDVSMTILSSDQVETVDIDEFKHSENAIWQEWLSIKDTLK